MPKRKTQSGAFTAQVYMELEKNVFRIQRQECLRQ